jgi:hypothetical protein
MSEQPEALRLADAIDPFTRKFIDHLTCKVAADELRRMHAVNQELLEALKLVRTMLVTGMPEYDAADVQQVVDAATLEQPEPDRPTIEQMLTVIGENQRLRAELKFGSIEPEQEPVAWVNHGENRITRATGWNGYGALYTNPPRREWRGLTDVEVEELQSGMQASHKDIRAIEAALKEKNA